MTTLHLERRFDAPSGQVFDAWIKPEIAGRWLFTAPGSESHSTDLDARAGGRWTVVDRREGVDYTALGEYLEIDRPRRLAFTFGMPQFSPEFCQVTIEIVPSGEGARLTLTQNPLPEDAVEPLRKGWNDMFGQLSALL